MGTTHSLSEYSAWRAVVTAEARFRAALTRAGAASAANRNRFPGRAYRLDIAPARGATGMIRQQSGKVDS